MTENFIFCYQNSSHFTEQSIDEALFGKEGDQLSWGLTRRSSLRSEIFASSAIAMASKSMARARGWP